MKKIIIIEGMSCEHCEMHTKKELEKEIAEDEFKAAVEAAGYKYIRTL